MPRSHTRRARGFTLTELLVVVFIIAVLIGILIPVVNSARGTAGAAATNAYLSTVQSAVASFRTDNRRLPGYFSQQQMGDTTNFNPAGGTGPGFTQMSNALLELSNPDAVLGEDADTSLDGILLVGPTPDANDRVAVERALIGSEGGYLEIPGEFFFPGDPAGQFGPVGSVPDNRRMPGIQDNFGLPVVMWARDELAGKDAKLVEMESDDPNERALFYWASNGAVFESERLTSQGDAQNVSSLLSTTATGGEDPVEISMLALLGHPGFPSAEDPASVDPSYGVLPYIPKSPRGDIILHSAGRNGVFLSRTGADEEGPRALTDPGAINKAVYFPEGVEIRSGDVDPDEVFMDFFDDIFLSGG